MASQIKDLKEQDFKNAVSSGVAVVGFWAPWCHTCHAVMPLLDGISESMKDRASFFKVNVVENPGLSSKYGVMSLPNILFFKENKVFDQIIGSTNKQVIETKINKLLCGLPQSIP